MTVLAFGWTADKILAVIWITEMGIAFVWSLFNATSAAIDYFAVKRGERRARTAVGLIYAASTSISETGRSIQLLLFSTVATNALLWPGRLRLFNYTALALAGFVMLFNTIVIWYRDRLMDQRLNADKGPRGRRRESDESERTVG